MDSNLEETFNHLSETISKFSILYHDNKNAIYLFDERDEEVFGIDILGVRSNHPKRGSKADWEEHFDLDEVLYTNFKQPSEFIGKAFFCWSKIENEILFILLYSDNNLIKPALNHMIDLEWCKLQLELIWSKAFSKKKIPEIIIINPFDNISIYDLYLHH